ncbi:MAG: PIN domain-containing protein [Rhodocyclaceae bacterium]|nr:PIN domain-containing protein [Rhodocyclaceae bacterium]MDP1956771.1 PIN domain-containing protein [Rhodocyclaceae bacterium]
MYLIDTDICVHAMSGTASALLSRLDACSPWEIALSSITLAELEFGVVWVEPALRPRRRFLLDALCEHIRVLPFDAAAARAYADIRRADPARGKNALDKLIAAHAVSVGAVLVTCNEDDFRRFVDLKVENWVA